MPVSALVTADALPFVDVSRASGQYLVPALSGSVTLTATVPNTALTGAVGAQAVPGQTVSVNIALNGAVTTASISPADGAIAVSPSTQITVSASAALNPQSISTSNIVLVEATPQGNQNVSLRTLLSPEGTTLAIIPTANLNPGSKYIIQVGGLTDIYKQAVAVPVASFTTKSLVPQSYDPTKVLHASGPNPSDGAGYTYDSAGNRTSKQNVQTGGEEDYTYDAIYQLTQVTQTVNGAASTTEKYGHDAVGNRLPSLGLDPWTFTTTASKAIGNSFRYTGREWDQETGLYYYRARYYDPTIGRFIREDPIGFTGGDNFYSYVGNAPSRFTDSMGLAPDCLLDPSSQCARKTA
jgi:RHS repeat-associated protein